MKKPLLVSFLMSVFFSPVSAGVELRDVSISKIYQRLSQEGHADTQDFTVSYKLTNGTFERNNKGELVPITKFVKVSDHAIPDVPNFGDIRTYQTEDEQGVAVYRYTYEYTYMQTGGQGQWILTRSTTVFLDVKEANTTQS